jgi:hypothetical protein
MPSAPRILSTPGCLLLTTLLFPFSLSFSPTRAAAQDTPEGLVEVRESTRHGLWLGLGLGAGGESYDLRPSVGYSDVLYRPTISFRIGGTVSQNLRLGGEVLSWINESGPAVESLTSALFVAHFYPFSGVGLYLKGGLGIGRNAVDFDGGYDEADTGFAGLIGAGYELRLGRRFFLNPVIDLVGHRYSNGLIGDYQERLVNFGLGILLQTGR